MLLKSINLQCCGIKLRGSEPLQVQVLSTFHGTTDFTSYVDEIPFDCKSRQIFVYFSRQNIHGCELVR